jgi:hypothetical protein
MEQEGLSALGRQLGNGFDKDRHRLLTGDLSFWRELEDRKIHLAHGSDVRAASALPKTIDRQIAGGLKEEGAQKAHRGRMVELKEVDVGFLSYLARLLFRADFRGNEAKQCRIVLAK